MGVYTIESHISLCPERTPSMSTDQHRPATRLPPQKPRRPGRAASSTEASASTDLRRYIDATTEWVASTPDIVGVTISALDGRALHTVAATDDQLRMIDAAQYLFGGPCRHCVDTGEDTAVASLWDVGDVPAAAVAATEVGAKSLISLAAGSSAAGFSSLNVYGSRRGQFSGPLPPTLGAMRVGLHELRSAIDALPAVIRSPRPPLETDDLRRLRQACAVVGKTRRTTLRGAAALLHNAAQCAGASPERLAKDIVTAQDLAQRTKAGARDGQRSAELPA
jgi:hypothetical protein